MQTSYKGQWGEIGRCLESEEAILNNLGKIKTGKKRRKKKKKKKKNIRITKQHEKPRHLLWSRSLRCVLWLSFLWRCAAMVNKGLYCKIYSGPSIETFGLFSGLEYPPPPLFVHSRLGLNRRLSRFRLRCCALWRSQWWNVFWRRQWWKLGFVSDYTIYNIDIYIYIYAYIY